MAIYTITDLKDKINEVLASNNSGKITAGKLAALLHDVVDSATYSGSLAFPFSGSAQVTGSFNVTGSILLNSQEVATQNYVSNSLTPIYAELTNISSSVSIVNNEVLLLSSSLAAISSSITPAVLQDNLTVELGTGVTFGGVQTGTSFSLGSTLEQVLRTLLIKEIPPVYNQPVSSLSSNVSFSNREVGEVVSPTFNLTYTQNDGGTPTHFILRKNGATLTSVTSSTSPQSISDLGVQVISTAITYVSRINYNTGPIKNTNLGNPYPSGQILAGFKDSSTLTLLGYRKGFYGTTSSPSPTIPSTSNDVRALAGSILNPNNLSTFTLNIPVGTTMVVFAYPNTLTTPNSVFYVEGGNIDVKAIFTEISISVEGANGFTPIPYRVFYYTPVAPFSSTATYNVTI